VTRGAVVAASGGVRARLAALLGRVDSVTVVASATSTATLAAAAALAPGDVVLVHAATPDALTRDLESLPPLPVVVLVPTRSTADTVTAALRAGARGVLPDDAGGDEIAAALEAAAVGLVVVPSEQVGDLVASRAASPDTPDFAPRARDATRAPLPSLTPREGEILAMLAEGLPNKLIAARLGISDHTVKTHLEAIFDKLGASTRAEAVARAVRSGLLLL
jgi:DNA-binding NarL/FixJ family response regulator